MKLVTRIRNFSATGLGNKLMLGMGSLGLIGLIGFGTAAADTVTISNTGYGSVNHGSIHTVTITRITNNNLVNIINHTIQWSSSGHAVVTGNTNGGNASSGSSGNSNSTSTSVVIVNNN